VVVQTRAIAESVQKVTWRFICERSQFLKTKFVIDAKSKFLRVLQQSSTNTVISLMKWGSDAEKGKVTQKMLEVHQFNCGSYPFLSNYRITNQQNWYAENPIQQMARKQFFWAFVYVRR